MMTLPASGRSEDLCETRPRKGQESCRERRPLEAADLFRIASLGFLDRPVLLCERLARLALAQAALRRSAESDG